MAKNAHPHFISSELTTDGPIVRVSTSSTGAQANGDSFLAASTSAFSADGTKVYFFSTASNLVSGDTNGQLDIFAKDLTTGVVTRLSTNSSGGEINGSNAPFEVSADGTKLVFTSTATNLVAGDTNGTFDVFVKDLTTGAVTRVSTASDGTQADSYSTFGHFSPDGNEVIFRSNAGNLVAGGVKGYDEVYVKNLTTGAISLVSERAPGTFTTGTDGAFSPDGTKVVYTVLNSDQAHTESGDTGDIYVRDLSSNAATRISSAMGGADSNGYSYGAQYTADGSKIIFNSSASNLVAGDTNGAIDVFAYDVASGTITRLSTDAHGNQLSQGAVNFSLSPDGTEALFYTTTPGLVPADTTANTQNAFVVNFTTGQTAQVDTTATGQQSNDLGYGVTFAPDGHSILLASLASNLVAGDTNGSVDLFIKPLTTDVAVTTGSVVEGASTDATGTLLFTDTDLADTHTVSVNHPSQALGALTADITRDTTGAGTGGRVEWDYHVDPAVLAALGQGETRTDTFTVSLTDGHTATQETVTITLTGTAGDLSLQGTNGAESLMGGSGNDTIKGLGGDDHLYGLDGNDSLVGGAGADTMFGGHGDDTYVVDSLSDIVSEESTGAGIDDSGNDRVFSTVSYTLGNFIEGLNLDGSGDINGTGNDLQNNIYGNGGANLLSGLGGNDKLKGGAGDDTLIGGAGNDILEGGTGSDHFVFDAAGASNGVDRISDFEHGIDWLVFSTADYDASAAFTVGSAAVGAGAQFVWNGTTGTLLYDHDGAGGDAAIAIATFTNAPTLDASDLHFV